MGALLDFFTGGTGRIQALLYAAAAMLVVSLSLTAWALVERVSAVQARAERDHALDQVAVISAAAKACTTSVDHAGAVGQATIKAVEELQAAAARLAVPPKTIVQRTETIIQHLTPELAGDCNAAWAKLEQDRKAATP
jgi:hypothetical protein